MVSRHEKRMCKICTWIIAEDKIIIIPTGITSHFSCFSDGAGYQGFPPGGYKCLLFFIIGRLINKSGVDSAWALVVDRFSIKSLEHRVTGVQRFPVTVLKQQQAISNMSMQLTHNIQRCLHSPPLKENNHVFPFDKHSTINMQPKLSFTCRLGCTMAMMFPLVSLG